MQPHRANCIQEGDARLYRTDVRGAQKRFAVETIAKKLSK
jgi:hypothetical protein